MTTILYTGNLYDGSEVRVITPDPEAPLAFVERNQGDHDRRFFILGLLPVDKAIEKAKRIVARSLKYKVK